MLYSTTAVSSDLRFSPNPNNARMIQWRTWGKEAFEEAKAKGRPVLLSISAVWCHWCHVMDETTYSDSSIINYLNEHFISVRVDADMRPDVDSAYNQGGWPSTVFLSPAGEFMGGGNYIRPEEMLALLREAVELSAKGGGKLSGALIHSQPEKTEAPGAASGKKTGKGPGVSDIRNVVEILKEVFDAEYGGFGAGQKFPNPAAVEFLISIYHGRRDPEIKTIITATLDGMMNSPLNDRVEGGFFRYATRRDWTSPHYEKMLEVNAGMIRNYAEAYMTLGKREYLDAVHETIKYVTGNLHDRESGAFYGSQDADEAYYKKTDRGGLKRPFVDKTAYADSSSLMITAMLSAFAASGKKEYLDTAEKGAGFILDRLYLSDKGVFHYHHNGTARLQGLLEDNALFGSAMLDLYEFTGRRRYLKTALNIGDIIANKYYVKKTGNFTMSVNADVILPAASGEIREVSHFRANCRALLFLSRLSASERYERRRKLVNEALGSFSDEYEDLVTIAPQYASVLMRHLSDPVEVTIISADDGRRIAFLSAVNRIYIPRKVVRTLSPLTDAKAIKTLRLPSLEAVYICAGKRCSAPIRRPEDLESEISRFL